MCLLEDHVHVSIGFTSYQLLSEKRGRFPRTVLLRVTVLSPFGRKSPYHTTACAQRFWAKASGQRCPLPSSSPDALIPHRLSDNAGTRVLPRVCLGPAHTAWPLSSRNWPRSVFPLRAKQSLRGLGRAYNLKSRNKNAASPLMLRVPPSILP